MPCPSTCPKIFWNVQLFYVTLKIDLVNSVFMSAANRYCEMRFKNGKKKSIEDDFVWGGEGENF